MSSKKSNKFWLWALLGLFIIFMSLVLVKNSQALSTSECWQANYAPDSLVKNGHAIDQNDLYTRHMGCPGESKWNPGTFVQQIKHKIHTVLTVVTNPGGNNTTPSDGSGEKPAKNCHNKNDGKDNNKTDCNAGKGNDNK